TFRQGVAEQLPFGDGEFDLVFSTMTFHHWADQRKGMGEVARVLKADGIWLLADFVPTGPVAWFVMRRFPRLERLKKELYEVGLGVRGRRLVTGLVGQVSVLEINRN